MRLFRLCLIFLCAAAASLIALTEYAPQHLRKLETLLHPAAAARPAAPVPPGRFSSVTRRGLSPAEQPAGYSYEPGSSVRRAARQAVISHNGQQRTIQIAAQPGRSAAPVVFLLHGSGRNGLSMIDMWLPVARQKGVVLIAPDSPRKNWQAEDMDSAFISLALDAASELRPVDRERVYLFGHSFGAIYASALANSGQTIWKAVALHGGYASGLQTAPKADAPPLRIYLGTEDHLFSAAGAQETGQALAAAGHDVSLHLIPSHTHWFYEIGPRIAADAWSWFRSRPGPAAEPQSFSN